MLSDEKGRLLISANPVEKKKQKTTERITVDLKMVGDYHLITKYYVTCKKKILL